MEPLGSPVFIRLRLSVGLHLLCRRLQKLSGIAGRGCTLEPQTLKSSKHELIITYVT